MATDEQVIKAAEELGTMLAKHPKVSRLEAAVKKLREDSDAQRALNDLNRHLNTVAEKEMTGQPIEVSDKQKMRELQNAVVHNLTLQEFQLAQMDYVDLVRKLDDAMYGSSAAAEAVGVTGQGAGQGAGPAPGGPGIG